MKKIIYIVSDINKSLAFEWIATSLNRKKYKLEFILIGNKNTALEAFLIKNNITCYSYSFISKLLYPLVFFKILFLLIKIKPHVVHCHFLKANLLGLTASAILFVPKRIYTRHHSTFHHTYHPKGVYLDRASNFLSTHIIAISDNVKQVLINKEHVAKNKIVVIPHGFDLSLFEVAEGTETIQKKYFGVNDSYPVIGVVARYIEWKGIQYIITAFQKLLPEFPKAHLILANAVGPDQGLVHGLLPKLPASSYTEISFEENIAALYHLMDVYVHVPVDAHIEAFGQTYVEALAAGVPSVFTLSGISKEFIQDEKNAIVVPFRDSDAIFNAIKRLLQNSDLKMRLMQQGKLDVKRFNLNSMIKSLEQIYAD